jgi:hypothetical protein
MILTDLLRKFMLRQAQHERLFDALGRMEFPYVPRPLIPFVLSLSKERTGVPDMGGL